MSEQEKTLPAADQVMETELVRLGSSPIHGHGGFAKCAIAKGTRVIEYIGEKIDKKEALARCIEQNQYIFTLDDVWDLDGNFPWNPARLLNHSCAPNCDADVIDGRIWIIANRDIAAGEEVTFNYNFDLEDYQAHPCKCGSPGCVGYIVAEELFDHVRKKTREAKRNAEDQSRTV